MEKNGNEPVVGFSIHKKMMLSMRLILFLMLLGMLSTNAATYAQRTKLDLSFKDRRIREVLNQIEDQSEFTFMYDNSNINVERKVSLDVKSSTITEILDKIFQGTNVSYKSMGRHIMLFAGSETVIPLQKEASVKGRVTDSSGQPLPGVSVVIKNKSTGTITDVNGNYSLTDVPSEATLVFSFVGMQTQEVLVADKTNISIAMQEETIGIEEVVAVGYGKVQKKEELTGSVAVVKTEALADRVSPSVINMLQGSAAGVTVRQESSYPGMTGSIMVRNTSSWQGSTEPLYVIDGIISTASDFSRLSSTDIASISILKDAASSAIYGMRAGNGVIIINTKQGNSEKTQLTYQVSNTMQEATSITSRPPDTYTALDMTNKALKNLGFTDDHPWIFAADELEYFKTHNFDPLDAVLGDPGIKNHTLSVSGGKGDTKYYVSGSVFNQDGLTKNYTYNKYSFLAKVSGKINKNISFDLTFNMGWSDMNQPYAGDSYDQGMVFGWTLAEQRFVPPYIDGKPLREATTIADGQSGIQHLKSNMSKPVFKLKYQVPFVKGLSVSGIASYENQYDYMKRFVTVPYYYAFKMAGSHNHIYTNEVDTSQGNNGLLPSGVVRGLCGGQENQLNVNTSRLYSYDLQWLVNYERIFGKHNVSAMAGYEQWATGGDYLNGWGRKYTNTNFQEIDGADPDKKYTGVSGNQTNLSGQASYFGRLDYNYDRKYMLGFTFRADGTYIFPPDSRWGYFPAGSAAWNMSEEPFFERLKPYISALKLRASYGLTGSSATGPWQWQQSYAYSSNINYILDGVASSGVGLGTVVNPNITWEKNKNIDLGTDITLFKGLGTITMDYWHKKTTDILAARVSSTPNTVGASLPAVNYGEAAASGFEISVGHNNSIGAFKYGASGNFAISSNKYLKIDQSTIVRDYQNVIGTSIDGQIWGSTDLITQYVNNFYTILPSWDRMDLVSAESNQNTKSTVTFLKGKLTSTDGYPAEVWDYGYVRRVNEFFENIKTATAVFGTGEKERLMGQAYFFRAYIYYRMLQSFGGVPIITNVQNPAAELSTLYVKRNSSLETFDFIAGQLDSAIMNLPAKGTSGYGAERITKAAAMAMKGKLLLLKASPLFCKTSNNQYWTDAYNTLLAARNELDAEGYGLYEDGTKWATDNILYKKNEARKEMVIYIAFNDPAKTNWHQAAQLPLLYSQGAAGGQIPTWELVESYPMKDGKDISESSDYDPTMFWKNRDPRFYSTIVYNGAVYGVGSIYRRIWLFEEIVGDPYYSFNHGCSTGFYCRKGIDTTYVIGSTTKPFQNQAMDWAVIRYPEIMLDLAECANQSDAHRVEAKNLIISIRKRAGIDAGSGSYGLASGVGTDKTVTLKAIMKERQIEFAYEGKRFMDLRRLRMYSELNNLGQLHAMGPRLNKNGVLALNLPGINENSDISDIVVALTEYLKPGSGHDVDAVIKQVTNYTKEAIDTSGEGTISLSDKYYFYPIPPDLLLQNPELKQNKDWDNGTFEPAIQ